jgi:nucleoside-diphosphate-sugar epimerase
VRTDARIPFMAMPDAVDAILKLATADKRKLTRVVYNIGAFAPTAGEVEAIVRKAFPKADVTYKLDEKRANIVGSWPADVDDTAARLDWGLAPRYDLSSAFNEYLIPTIKKRYG